MDLIGGKVPVVQRQDYIMYLEHYEGMPWFHTDVFRWSTEVKAKYLEELNLLQHLLGTPMIALIDPKNSKLVKFATIIGFQFEQPFMLNNGTVQHIYSRSI